MAVVNRDPARFFSRPVFERLRRVCLALPDVTEALAWNHPAFRIGKKTFCVFEMIGGRPSIGFRLPKRDTARWSTRRHFFRTPYGRDVWVSRWVDVPVDARQLATLIRRSHAHMAPQRERVPRT
jgi:predicted DNA-binding protein (MmcQ/YjbR family)